MAFTGADLIEPTGRLSCRGHEEPEGGIATGQRVEDLVPNALGFIDQQRGGRLELIVDTFDVP
jgi:hypothetical protein